MALNLTLDYAVQIVAEPGYWKRLSAEEWERNLNPLSDADAKRFWSDPATRTLMLYPRQHRAGFLNSADQLDSIIGLIERGSGTLEVNATNLTAGRVYEAAVKGNANNPWIHTAPIPGTGATFLPLLAALGAAALEAKLEFPATSSDFRVIAYSKEKLIGNQALCLRWFQPDQRASGLFIQGFSIGQFTLVFTGDLMEVHQDISAGRDRTSFRRLMSVPLFSSGSVGLGSNSGANGRASLDEAGPQDRAIFWLPYHRNLILVYASSGKWALIKANTIPVANGLSGDSSDWLICEDRELLVFGISGSVGRFQVQKIKWADAAQVRLPKFRIDYAPATPLNAANIVDDFDANRGTSLTHGTPTTPAGYDNYVNTLDTCPPVTTDATDTTREYGVTYSFIPSPDNRFTPFLYGVEVRLPRTVNTWPISGITISDSKSAASYIVSAQITSSVEKASETGLRMEAMDTSPFALATRWYRSEYPVRLFDTVGPVTLFVGIARPNQVRPEHYNTSKPRHLEMTAESLWRWMSDAPLRDQRDWTGEGHITVVDKIAQLAGIDTAGADYPSPLSDWNTPLGGVHTRIPQMGALKPHWQPTDQDTAASFIQRIADQFSGYVVGFYPNGQFFYLPRDPWFYNTSEGTFFRSRQSNPAGPIYMDPVEFEPVEPEANVVQIAGNSIHGGKLRSGLWIDWASILNQNAVNFIGRWRPEIFPIDGVLTCSELNRIGYVVFKQNRRRHLKVRFRADYVPTLRVGRVFALEGQPGLYRLMRYEATYEHKDYPQAIYEAELVEQGYE